MFWDIIRVNDIWWNFEKFVIDRDGRPLYRIHPAVWEKGDVVKPFLEEAFALKTTNGQSLQTNSDSVQYSKYSSNSPTYNTNSPSYNSGSALRPLAILG